MKIVITGATGTLGQELVPLLNTRNIELLLVGRDPNRISELFPGKNVCCYKTLPERAKGFDLLIHLAVINNDSKADEATFHAVNVELTIDVAEIAKQANITCFINISSVHALDDQNLNSYANTKREAIKRLANLDGINVFTIYLPLTYGDRWSGKLKFLNTLPRFVARSTFAVLATIKPSVHVSRLAATILNIATHQKSNEIILSEGQRDNPIFSAIKRTIDILFALSVVLFFGWALALIWALAKLQSPGPGIFAQQRIGREGQLFTCYKFRTMQQGTIQAGTHDISADSVTKIGSFLRKTKLDELPQIWNILRNEVSLIGPRPCLPIQIELIEARKKRGVLSVKPGISGLAQINDIDMSDPIKLAYWDARYIALQSLQLDFKIILATVLGNGQGDRTS